jgi:hypothetical protein
VQDAYLFRMDSKSCNSGRSGRVAPLSCADVVLGAPLERFASMSVRLRFAGDGDEGVAGSIGGVRVPLAVAMVMAGAGRDAVETCNALRAQETDLLGCRSGPAGCARGARCS